MKQYSTNSCSYKLNFNGPDTVEEYDKRAGTGQCLEDAVSNTIYRGTLPEWQEEFAAFLEKETGIKRGIDEDATAKLKGRAKNPDNVNPQPEKFRVYNARVKGTWVNGDDKKELQLQSWAQQVADKILVDPAPSVRQTAATKGNCSYAAPVQVRSSPSPDSRSIPSDHRRRGPRRRWQTRTSIARSSPRQMDRSRNAQLNQRHIMVGDARRLQPFAHGKSHGTRRHSHQTLGRTST